MLKLLPQTPGGVVNGVQNPEKSSENLMMKENNGMAGLPLLLSRCHGPGASRTPDWGWGGGGLSPVRGVILL